MDIKFGYPLPPPSESTSIMNGPKGTTVQFKILNALELIMSLFVNVRMVSKEMVQNLVYLKVSLKKKMVRKHTYVLE